MPLLKKQMKMDEVDNSVEKQTNREEKRAFIGSEPVCVVDQVPDEAAEEPPLRELNWRPRMEP